MVGLGTRAMRLAPICIAALVALAACARETSNAPFAVAVASEPEARRLAEEIIPAARAICVQSHVEDSFPANMDGGHLSMESQAYLSLGLRRQPFRMPDEIEETRLIEVFDAAGVHTPYYQPNFLLRIGTRGIAGCYAADEVAVERCPADGCVRTSLFVISRSE